MARNPKKKNTGPLAWTPVAGEPVKPGTVFRILFSNAMEEEEAGSTTNPHGMMDAATSFFSQDPPQREGDQRVVVRSMPRRIPTADTILRIWMGAEAKNAYERRPAAGRVYYPKLLSAVPVSTPVPGPRLLLHPLPAAARGLANISLPGMIWILWIVKEERRGKKKYTVREPHA